MQGNPWTPGLFVPNHRSIGGIVAQVTIEEREHDELFITEHPIEQGAPINDHAFKRPSEVNIRAGWSASGAGDLSANGNGVYGLLLSWQAALNPFDLYTGKRVYHNMLIQSLVVTTDHTSEFALMADITCRQVIFVRTQTAQVAISNDTAAQKSPESTATPDNKGEQQPRPVGNGGKIEAVTGPDQFGPPDPSISPGLDPNRASEGMPALDPNAGLTGEGQKLEGEITGQPPAQTTPPLGLSITPGQEVDQITSSDQITAPPPGNTTPEALGEKGLTVISDGKSTGTVPIPPPLP